MDGCRKEKSEFFGKICRKINLNFSPRNDEEKLGTQTVTKVRRSKKKKKMGKPVDERLHVIVRK